MPTIPLSHLSENLPALSVYVCALCLYGCVCVLMDKEDWVHLPEEAERQEYVMAEEGIIYRGSADRIGPLAWNFGQVRLQHMCVL